MMFWRTAAVMTALTGGSASARGGRKRQSEIDVADTMQQMFKAFEVGDQAQLDRLTTTDFHVFESGQYISREKLLARLQSLRKEHVVYEWNVTLPKLQVYDTFATIAYVNQGAITKDGVRTPTTWFESGTLRLDHDRWRVVLVQSEKVKPESTPR